MKETQENAIGSDIMQILHRDHNKVGDMFFKFQQSEDDAEKKEIVSQIALELSLHAKAEEEIVYPAIRDGKEEVEDMMDEADTEHHIVKFLVAELQNMEPSDDHYDSKVTVLCELVKHHVKEEESDIFEKLKKKSESDLEKLGAKFNERKMQLSEKPIPADSFPVQSNMSHRKSA